MRTMDWALGLAEHPALHEALTLSRTSTWQSVAYEARPILIASAYRARPRKMLIVTANYERALAWQAKLQLCGINPEFIHQLPSGISQLFEDAAPEHIALSDRLGALKSLVDGAPNIVIAAPGAVLERTLPADILREAFIELKPGDEIDSDKLLSQLTKLGYEPQEPVRIPGQYSRRGGIVDVFPAGRDMPVRIELFGDEIESIRVFDPNTQRSVGNVPVLSLAPSRETLVSEDATGIRDLVLDALEREAAMLGEAESRRLEEIISGDAEALAQRVYFDRLDLYRPLLHPDSGCALDLLDEDGIVILDEPLELDSLATRQEDEIAQALTARANRGEILHSTALDYMLTPGHLSRHSTVISISSMNTFPEWIDAGQGFDLDCASLDPYRGRADALASTLQNYKKEEFTMVFTTDQPNRAKSVLSQADITPIESLESKSILANGNIGGGFVFPSLKLAVISDAELFGVARLRLPQKRFMEGAPIATVLDLKSGDFVVHIHYGIGIFRGLVKRDELGVEKEFLAIDYAPPGKLFVPADQLDRIQKYLNPGDDMPKLNSLTGGEWQRTLGKAKEEAKAFARDLVKLYAQRKRVQRRPYGSDTPFQHEMESTFPWVETPSQLMAIRDAKKDLELDYPMDRLVCGDVGFGKTEVAIRAAFKAVQGGRQVAVLCPTTILSEQHFRNFSERLGSFGTRIELINRFTHATEKRAILDELKAGNVEILIGTHSLLGSGVVFKDLGMVVIDEEQKFGVKQKEMLKHLRTEVDVLTLSATPIPRTLSMALMDIRQMSLINDPPPGRLPIRTYLRPYQKEVIREAILRELARGGQVFYVYNRVESIGHVAETLRKLVPTARIGVGHGQMHEKELEPIMVGFVKGEIDILLSTTIIENGIDISNANTLIVENADRLGLSQLYQLRGRVGRSDRQAYAYFLYASHRDLSEGGLARLQALQEFSSLGSGYSLAFRDLQIRGAGELLGAKQHGTMANVGYELYTQLINEAVQLLKNSVDGEADGEIRDPLEALQPLPAFEVPIVALLPDTYIKDQAQRLYFYQKLMACRDELTLGAVQGEVEDRYGRMPLQATQAFAVMALRMVARDLGVDKLDARGGRVSVSFKDKQLIPPRVFSMAAKQNREAYLTRESYIWPYTGAPLPAISRMFDTLNEALAEIEMHRQALGI